MNNCYFSKNGLTSVSANFIANKAKEFYTSLEMGLLKVSFLDEYIATVHAASAKRVKNGTTLQDMQKFQGILDTISECKSLIAWLREAIKEKERRTQEIEGSSAPDVPEYPERPVPAREMTIEDALAQMSIGERQQYLSLEARCAEYGSFLHLKGAFNIARKELSSFTPAEYKAVGNEVIVTTREPSATQEEADSIFFILNERYRNAQAELNGMKHVLEVKVRDMNLFNSEEYRKSLEEYSRERERISVERDRVLEEFRASKKKALEEVEALRIVIPDNLVAVYDRIRTL